MPYLGIFGLEFLKTLLILKPVPSNLSKKESINHTVTFGIGSAFCKGPGPGPGPPYKICPLIMRVNFSPSLNFCKTEKTKFQSTLPKALKILQGGFYLVYLTHQLHHK